MEGLRLTGDVGCRHILADHPEDILEIEVDSDAVLDDIDNHRDYREHMRRRFQVSLNDPEGGFFSIREAEVISLVGRGGKLSRAAIR